MSKTERQFKPLNILLITVSDTRNEESDHAGRLLQERASDAGHVVLEKRIVIDDVYRIRAQVSLAVVDAKIDVVILSGGTGVTGRDGTPEAVRVLFDKTLDGFGEIFRQRSWEQIGTSTIQSRAIAGVANGTYIFALPGSSSACRFAWDELLVKQLDYRTRPCNLVELMPRLKE